jgi:uncharacterized protein (TIGR03437 family)
MTIGRAFPRLLLLTAVCACGARSAGSLAVVNAASYTSQISPGSIVTAFGAGLPSDADTAVMLCPPEGTATACAPAAILAASATQINFVVPNSLPSGNLTVQVIHNGTQVAAGNTTVTAMSPGIFTADNSGTGIFNGQSYDGGQYNAVYSPGPVPRAVAPKSGSAPNVLILYGTGWRNAVTANVQVTIGSVQVTPAYAGPSSMNGLDQINVSIPPSVAGDTAQLLDLSVSFNYASDSTTGAYRTRTVKFCLAGSGGASACPPLPAVTPSCSEPLPGLAAPYGPHGIFALVFQGANPVPISNYILKQPAVCGADLYVVWSQVDHGNGSYDWSALDAQIKQWTQAGKTVNLIVWGVSDARPNNGTPAYVLSDRNYHSVTCQENGLTLQYPVYYTDSYKGNYKAFVGAVLNRYAGNSSIGYIRVGLARGGEVFPTCLQQMMTFSGFATIDQFNAQWEGYIAEMTSLQKSLQTQIIGTAGHAAQLMAAVNQYGSPIQTDVLSFEAANAKSLGFGFGSQGLTGSDVSNYAAGRPCSSNWCMLFQTNSGQVPLELQTIAASDPANAPGGVGSLGVLLPFALSLNTQILEIYVQDLQVAYDPTSPSYAQYSPAYQQVLTQTATSLGFAPH